MKFNRTYIVYSFSIFLIFSNTRDDYIFDRGRVESQRIYRRVYYYDR